MNNQRPRHSRKEIRDFADRMVAAGWVFHDFDTNGHAEYRHPPTGARYTLPETPHYFPIARNWTKVQRLMGATPDRGRTSLTTERRRTQDALQRERAEQERQRALRPIVAAIDARQQRANNQLRTAANDYGCTPSQAERRRTELMSIANLMGAGTRGL